MNKEILDKIILGIDYGEARIGLAFGRNGFVSPLTVITARNEMTAIHEIIRVALENKADLFVVGLPLGYDHRETLQSNKVRLFSKRLKVLSRKPVEFVDEYNSSNEGLEHALEEGVNKKARRTTDQYSAGVILKTFYEPS